MLCNYAFGWLVTFGPKAVWIQFVSLTVILTFLLLLFGEIMPKVYSRQAPLAYCRKSVSGIMFMRRLFWSIETILIKSGIFLEKVVHKEGQSLSVDDLEQALELTDKDDIKDEQSILQGIIRFGDETAKEVMTSRQDIVDIDIPRCSPAYSKTITAASPCIRTTTTTYAEYCISRTCCPMCPSRLRSGGRV